jgi:hypothetical protein
MSGELVVATMDGLIRIPLTGDAKLDALLERIARRGGTLVRRDGGQDAEVDMRLALGEGA